MTIEHERLPPTVPSSHGRPAFEPGVQLGAYRLLEIVGEGVMGYVYRAEHVRLGREVAIKLLRPEYASRGWLTEIRLWPLLGCSKPNTARAATARRPDRWLAPRRCSKRSRRRARPKARVTRARRGAAGVNPVLGLCTSGGTSNAFGPSSSR